MAARATAETVDVMVDVAVNAAAVLVAGKVADFASV